MGDSKLKPFSIAGVLSSCPECGASGDYNLLVKRVRAIEKAWNTAGKYPDTASERAAIDKAIQDAVSAIGMQAQR